jgi:hypothetical protein
VTLPRRLLLALCCLAALPAAAAAAPPWSAPQNLSASHLFVFDPAIAFSGNGTALAAWRWQDGTRADAVSGESAAVRPSGAPAFGAESRLSPAGRVGAPVLYAQSRAVIALVRPVGSNRDANSQLRVAFGSASGSFGPSHLIVKRPGIARPELAGNARGDLALVWFEDRGTSNDRVYVSVRRAGGSFGAPVLLAQERIRNVSAAIGPRSDVLVAWDARGIVRTRFQTNGRRSFGSTDTITSEDTFSADLRTAVADNGRAYVAWGAQLRTEGGTTGPVFFEAAVRPARSSGFRLAQLLDRLPDTRSANPLDIALVGNGAIVGWTGFDGAANRVRVAETDAAGHFGPPADVSQTDSTLTDVAAGWGGQRLVVWTTGTGSPRSVQAAFAAPGAGFGAPELISAGMEADSAVAAFAPQNSQDPLTSPPTVVWVNRPDGSTHPLADIRTYAQAATRTG